MNVCGNIIVNSKLNSILFFLFYKGINVQEHYKTYPIHIILYNILIYYMALSHEDWELQNSRI